MRGAAEESVRRRVYLALEGGRMGGRLGIAVEATLISLIVLNVVAYTLQSIPRFERDYDQPFLIFEIVSIAVFALEYVLRLWTSPEDPSVAERGPVAGRIFFATRALMIIDFMAIAPALVVPFLPYVDLRFLRLVRLLRLLKIARYSPALSTLARVIMDERRALFGCLLLFLCAVLLAAASMHAAEGASQPGIFGTIPSAMWWAVSTLTTVGYGDAIPHSALGRVIAGITMIIGLALAALPVGIVATGFANSIHRRDFVVTFGMLARVPLFKGFDAQTVGELMNMLRAQAVSAGEIISGPGEHAAAMYFVVAGEIEVQLPGRKLRFSTGDFFGELALLHESMREATIIAVTSTRVLSLSANDFEGLLRRRPGLKQQILVLGAEESKGAVGPLAPEELREAHQVASPTPR
jgi:voltage-gated potassium channel